MRDIEPNDAARTAPVVDPRPVPPETADVSVRHLHRERDLGIGYGNSSGYGSTLHFTDGHVDPLFRCC